MLGSTRDSDGDDTGPIVNCWVADCSSTIINCDRSVCSKPMRTSGTGLSTSLARLPPDESAFLVRISILETVSPGLSAAVTGSPDAALYLQRLATESPVVTTGEGLDSVRLHHLARDFLLGQFDRLPAEAPKHRVRITKPFWLARHEVTRGQFRRFGQDLSRDSNFPHIVHQTNPVDGLAMGC